MKLTSSVFKQGGIIPSKYTCEGQNISPPLTIANVPREAKSLVLIVDDPDVPATVHKDRIWDHWVLFNIPPNTLHIEENSSPPATCGKNSFGNNRYGGPCPPDREHRYFFKLYALDRMLDLPTGATKKDVEHAMGGHILDQCHLMGRYEKGKNY